MRAEKTKLYEELSKKKGSKKWNEVFLKYNPNEEKGKKKDSNKKTKSKSKRKQKKTKKKSLFGF